MKIVDIYITLKGKLRKEYGDFGDNYSYCIKLSDKEDLQAVIANCRNQITQLKNSHTDEVYKELQLLNAEHQELSTQVVKLREEWELIKNFLEKQGIAIENDRTNFSNYALPEFKAQPIEAEF